MSLEVLTTFGAAMRLNTVLSAFRVNASLRLQGQHVRFESPSCYVLLTRDVFAS